MDRIIERLDAYLAKNDYDAAERHLLYFLEEAKATGVPQRMLPLLNELMGLYRKLGRREDALEYTAFSLRELERGELCDTVTGATTYINGATVYKAFGMAEEAMPLFLRAREICERDLSADDPRLGGLYNNMALALVDLRRFREAEELYLLALSVMESSPGGAAEAAVTHLNMASAAEAEHGLEAAEAEISYRLTLAEALLDSVADRRDGGYAFVCEKCAPVFGYYGYFKYENELKGRAAGIYEGT